MSAAQADLFRKSSEPEGFRYRTGVVAPAEKQRLASQITDLPLKEFLFQGFVAKRRVMSFGWRHDFERALRKDGRDLRLPARSARPRRGIRRDAFVQPARRSAGTGTGPCSKT